MRSPFYIIRAVVNIFFGIVEILLVLRLLLRLMGANVASGFVSWIYSTTSPFVAPFTDIVGDLVIGPFVLESATLIALFVYALFHLLIQEFLRMLTRPTVVRERVVV